MRLPYPVRPGQDTMGAAIEQVQDTGGHVIVEGGTGLGKTVVALAASLSATDGRRIVYATRTNSQQTQVVAEHAALRQAGQDVGVLIPFMGRRNLCPLFRDDARMVEANADELARLCRDAKRKAQQQVTAGRPVAGACPFYDRLLRDGHEPVEAILASQSLDAPTLARRIEAVGSCAYEALKLVMPKARAVVVPYIFLLDDHLRATLLQWMGTSSTEVHLVVDEAHHLPDAAREHWSPRLTATSLQRAAKEVEEFKDPVLAGTTLATTMVDVLARILGRLATQHVHGGDDADGLVPPGELDEALLSELRVATPHLVRIVADMERWGETIRDDRRAKGRLPRSYLGNVGGFLAQWLAQRDESHVHLVTGGPNPALELYLLDPAPALSFLCEFWSTTHMSGTMSPLDEHRVLCGLPATTRTACIPSPYAPEHLRIFGVEGLQRRFEAIQRDPGLVAHQQEVARGFLEACPGRTGLFFPSHQMVQDYLDEGFLHHSPRRIYVERPGMAQQELDRLVADFRNEPSGAALLLAVLGGRITEGLDFPGDALEHVLIFGVPYPKPSARGRALVQYYDRRIGNGWAIAVHNPVGRTLRQAVGRLIRGPDDRGTAVILDDRAVRFHAHLPRLRMVKGPEGLRAPSGLPAPGAPLYVTAHEIATRFPPGA